MKRKKIMVKNILFFFEKILLFIKYDKKKVRKKEKKRKKERKKEIRPDTRHKMRLVRV